MTDPLALGRTLLGRAVERATPARPGGNNRVYRLDTAQGPVALKVYPRQAEDPRDRLAAEWAALALLAEAGFADVPRPLARGEGAAAYTWIEGEPAKPDAAGVEHLAEFLTALQALRPKAQHIGLASAACIAPADAIAQYEARRARLAEAADAPARAFLEDELGPRAAQAVAELRGGLDAARPLAEAARILSPSDFGFHNALVQPNGRLAFLDFEYFGWDDPAKAVADAMLHPGSGLDDSLRARLLIRLAPGLIAEDTDFGRRFPLLFPLYGCIWCLILLNEYLPERWARRAWAGAGERQAALAAQLDKARRLLAALKVPHG